MNARLPLAVGLALTLAACSSGGNGQDSDGGALGAGAGKADSGALSTGRVSTGGDMPASDASVASDGALPREGDAATSAASDASVDAAKDAATSSAWLSGASSQDLAAFGTWRGRPAEALRFGNCDMSWGFVSTSSCSQYTGLAPDILGLEGEALFPDDGKESLAACATGAYDDDFAAFGTSLIAAGRGASVIALGWEANGNWYVWSFGVQSGDTSSQTVADYVACFRHEAAAIKKTDPAARISWNMNRQSYTGTTSVTTAYPGDDVVDEIAVDYYDIDYEETTADVWSEECKQEQNGGPEGLCAWLSFAQSHGKKLGIPEWGVSTGDDPDYIEQMYKFFAAHAADISYEAYFNGSDTGTGGSILFPPTYSPNASAMYQKLWASSPRP